MDTVLLAVTVLSLAMAVAMAFIVAKLMREERARADARVNALTVLAAQQAAAAPIVAPPIAAAATAPPPTAAEAADAVRPVRVVPRPARVERAATIDDLDLRPGAERVAAVPHLFEQPAPPSPWGRRLAVIGAFAAVVIAIAFVLTSSRSDVTASPSAAAAAPPPVVLDSAPLELVSLRHTQEAERLVITGLVQNPRTGSRMSHVVATAFLFGPDGAFLTSSRAPLDFTTLAPGDESPFVVSVPVTGPVARYRIGFRTDDGRVIEHVDKRAPDALAQK